MIQQPSAKFWSSVLAIAFIASGFTVMAQEQFSESAVFRDLPQGIASFGAAELGDYVYVYSGHTGRTHTYSLDAISKGFFRASLKQGGSWECLPMERPAQGVALLAVDNELYRIGGMQAQNMSEEPHDLFSLSEVAAFDPDARTWRRLPDLPDPRSSHRAAVLQDHIYVFGGWTLQGGEDGMWLEHGLVLDRNNESAGWSPVSQPTQLRSLEVISYSEKIWLIGGLTPEGRISQKIHIFHPATGSWSRGPDVPGMPANGNGIAAAVVGDSLVLAGMDGKLYRLTEDQKGWNRVGQLPSSRIHHRLIGDGNVAGGPQTDSSFGGTEFSFVTSPMSSFAFGSAAFAEYHSRSIVFGGVRMSTTTHPNSTVAPRLSSSDLLQPGDRMSRPEFLRRYQQMPHRSDIELVEGVVHMGSPVSSEGHASPHARLMAWLVHYEAYVPGLESGDNGTLHLDLENAPQPDCYLRITEQHGGQSTLRDGYVTGPPELIAEVASSSVSYDLHDKKHAYQRNGVLEYIVWRTRDRAIDWFVLTNGRYEILPATKDGILKSRSFNGLWLDAAAMLSHDMKRVLPVLQLGLADREKSNQAATPDP